MKSINEIVAEIDSQHNMKVANHNSFQINENMIEHNKVRMSPRNPSEQIRPPMSARNRDRQISSRGEINSQNSSRMKQRPFSFNQQPVVRNFSQLSIDKQENNSNGLSDDSSSSDWRDSVNQEPDQSKPLSETEDENVSDEDHDDMYES